MSHIEISSRRGLALGSQQLIEEQLGNLQKQIDWLREQLIDPQCGTESVDKSALRARVQEILRLRRRREKVFGGDLFGEPAWDMLLELFSAELVQKKLSVSDACYASAVPVTTALRWVGKLEQDGWIQRMNDPFDGRRSWLVLTDEGSDKMRRFLSALVTSQIAAGPSCPLE